MQIDTFTLVAQVINFALLVVFLRLVLYRPVLEAVRRRREELEREHAEARSAREQADQDAEEHRRALQLLAEGRAAALSSVESEAQALGDRLKQEARREAEQARAEWRREMERESDAFLEDVRGLVTRTLFSVAREVLRDVTDADLEERAANVFVRMIDDLPAPDRATFERAFEDSGRKLRVRSAHDPTAEQRARIRTALAAWLGPEVTLTFEVDPGLTLGFELLAGDRKVGWSIESRLGALEEESRRFLEGAREGR